MTRVSRNRQSIARSSPKNFPVDFSFASPVALEVISTAAQRNNNEKRQDRRCAIAEQKRSFLFRGSSQFLTIKRKSTAFDIRRYLTTTNMLRALSVAIIISLNCAIAIPSVSVRKLINCLLLSIKQRKISLSLTQNLTIKGASHRSARRCALRSFLLFSDEFFSLLEIMHFACRGERPTGLNRSRAFPIVFSCFSTQPSDHRLPAGETCIVCSYMLLNAHWISLFMESHGDGRSLKLMRWDSLDF